MTCTNNCFIIYLKFVEIGLWEELNNENFNLTEYREIKINEIGTSSYTMSPKQWIQRTNAIGLISKGGKYSIGTYAHPDLAFEFASWLNVEFKLYLIKEFERLKKNESYQNKIEWSVRRELVILSNLENLNAEMIEQGLEQSKRLERLNSIAKKQYLTLQDSNGIKKIEALEEKEKSNLLIK
ncbi:MAG: KilA-N domain-containing protein [Clostridia bacterium]|nr:KilA-N domain-containing protein [Clostridia bacterium]